MFRWYQRVEFSEYQNWHSNNKVYIRAATTYWKKNPWLYWKYIPFSQTFLLKNIFKNYTIIPDHFVCTWVHLYTHKASLFQNFDRPLVVCVCVCVNVKKLRKREVNTITLYMPWILMQVCSAWMQCIYRTNIYHTWPLVSNKHIHQYAHTHTHTHIM